jgi:hypothetical protein
VARPLKCSAVMSAHIDVVKRPATNSLDAVVVAALSARRLLAVAGSLLLVFSLGASLVLVPAAAADSDAKAAARPDLNLHISENPGNAAAVPAQSWAATAPPGALRAGRSRATTDAGIARAARWQPQSVPRTGPTRAR